MRHYVDEVLGMLNSNVSKKEISDFLADNDFSMVDSDIDEILAMLAEQGNTEVTQSIFRSYK